MQPLTRGRRESEYRSGTGTRHQNEAMAVEQDELRGETMMDKLITVKEAAARLHVSVEFIWKALRVGRLPRVKVGRLTRIREQDLESCIRVGVQL
jgi:excisionase family DNA binding protein